MARLLFASTVLLGALLTMGRAGVDLYVDPANGNDTLCVPYPTAASSTPSNVSCRTLEYALYGNASAPVRCNSAQYALHDVVVHMASGVHSIFRQVCIGFSSNVTLVADQTGGASINCSLFPNNDTSNVTYDNVYVYNTSGMTFRGLNFQHCGPVPSNVFVSSSSNVMFEDCTFRGNIGAPLEVRFTSSITLRNTLFVGNRNMYPAPYDQNETTVDQLYQTIITGGGFTFFTRTIPATILISNCTFLDNQAGHNLANSTRPVLLKANGHGGGVILRLANTSNSSVVIENSRFDSNLAEVDGGGVYVSLSQGASYNRLVMINNTFVNNVVQNASGGAVSVNSFLISFNNTLMVINNLFVNNTANAGGAFSVALYDSDLSSTQHPDNITFYNCSFISNSANSEGTAVGLFSLVHVDQIGFPITFIDCIFDLNLSLEQSQDTSALTSFRFPTFFYGNNYFARNMGGGITLLNTRMQANGAMQFINNTAVFGAGVAMDDRCLLEITPNIRIRFEGNVASESGGAIYVEFPPIRFVIDIFNRLCFLQYICLCNDTSDVAPQDWKNVSISFIRNTARLSGAAIYASDMQRCTWLANYTGNDTFINNSTVFKLPADLNGRNPFNYKDNKLTQVRTGSVVDTDLATAPLLIYVTNPSLTNSLVQPGETVAINLLAVDQLKNYREAVWSLEAPAQPANLDALSANNDTYLYKVPAFSSLPSLTNYTSTFTLNFSLLRTLGLVSNMTLQVEGCHPGYRIGASGVCECNTGIQDVLRCDENNRYVYLREGIWGTNDSARNLMKARVLPGYVFCNRQGRLSGCKFQFDVPNKQCRTGRTGDLCGTCSKGYAVTMDAQHCQKENLCPVGGVILAILCILVVVICALILLFNVELPNEMKGFVFYAQVIGLVYRPYSVGQSAQIDFDPLSIFLNLLGFSLPIPLCLSNSIKANYMALFGFITPVLIIFCIAAYTAAARCVQFFSNRSALKGITFLSLFVYKYIADASFLLISCQSTDIGFVYQYDGSQKCGTWPFVIFFAIGLVLVVLFVAPSPFVLGFIILKRRQRFQQYVDVLTKGLQNKHRWWAGWDIGRRLPFVFVAYLVVLGRPSLVLFFMSLVALTILIVHLFTKPFENKYTNIIEAAILLNLLMVTAAFLDPLSSPIPEQFKTFLVVLPYVYAFCYLSWRIAERINKKYNFTQKAIVKVKTLKSGMAPSSADVPLPDAPPTTTMPINQKTEKRPTPPSTEHSSVPPSQGGSGSSASKNTFESNVSTNPPPPPQQEENFTEFREPLLD